ncbi:MFS transporter [Marinobacter sp. ATCH36]|uniref:MFS transporter n=1 Tax=Marinobacter sp. ATCH36 TaxID=2945106 RepID=UPI002022369B|nr:MFS transporter [Marinobacter sp. ATCH36]MCL7944973.1 MFS transporter [Marinobacter sp. ATCH36]
MAENESTVRHRTNAEEPLLRKGRPADPQPAVAGEKSDIVGAESAKFASSGTGREVSAAEADEQSAASEDPKDIETTLAESRQRKLRLMLRQCDRVLLLDFELLALPDWPDNYTLSAARRNRDLWLFSALLAAVIFLSGMTGFVPAWIAGGGFGAFVIILLMGVPAIRRLYTSRPSYMDLIVRRRRLLRDARKHIEHLEGKEGLIWQCARMAEFNPALKAMRFSELLALSERRALARNMTRREHVRLYLVYLLEAEKAYSRAQQVFFEGHQQAIDKGWESVASEPDRRT